MLGESYFVVSLKQGFPTSINRIIFLQSVSHIATPYENINLCSFSPASTGVYNHICDLVMNKSVCSVGIGVGVRLVLVLVLALVLAFVLLLPATYIMLRAFSFVGLQHGLHLPGSLLFSAGNVLLLGKVLIIRW
ncbi:hypothetical protein CEXT_599931 [Caerostris extrusa]|uniref:Uncharacterized protein n=1 Tax=Caerostris extrusa TaxID=172846 RepID=A0AAV4PH84_CAEEX|nr:hypothetical protein CEXT_599931 [Caerostris extrusa]